jgi:hypothetical protein
MSDKPLEEVLASHVQLLAVLIAAAIHMVDSKKLVSHLPAARTSAVAVVLKTLQSRF